MCRWKLNNYWGGTPVFLGALYAPGGFVLVLALDLVPLVNACAAQHAYCRNALL